MKLFLITIVLIICSAVPSFPRDTTGNLLVNGGFELVNKGSIPDGWEGNAQIYSLSNEAASGKYSLKYSNNDITAYYIFKQVLYVGPGLTYSAGVKIKTRDITGEDNGATFCIEWLDRNGKWFGGSYPIGIKGTNNWTEISSIISIPYDAAKIVFCCYVRKRMTGEAWFDDAYLKLRKTDEMELMLLKPVYRGLLFEEADQKVILSVNLENFGRDLNQSEILTSLVDSSGEELNTSTTKITGDNLIYKINFDNENLPAGNYTIKVMLEDKQRELIDSGEVTIEKIGPGLKPDVYFDEHKRLMVKGKAKFPLGMYWSAINEDDLNIYADSKFNFLLPYSPPDEKQMKLAEKYNLKVIYSVKDFYAGNQFAPAGIKSRDDEHSFLTGTVERFKNSPALLAWYNNDELRPEYLDRLNEHYNLIARLDSNHPVLSIITEPYQTNLYLNSTDIIGTDPYVVPKLALLHVGMHTVTVKKKLNNSRPVWMVIQAHNIGNYIKFIPNPEEYRSPDYDEMRSMSWQAICEGANGLIFYSFFDLKRNADVPFDEQWSDLKKIAAEIDMFSDILLSTDRIENVKVEGVNSDDKWFSWRAIKYLSYLYIFVINNGESEGEIKIQVPANYSKVQLMKDPLQNIRVTNSEFKDTLQYLNLKIYRVE